MNDFKEILAREAKRHDIELSDEQILQLDVFRCLLLERNKMVNLTSITESEDFAKKHVIDSLMIIKHIEIDHEAKIMDVGTGPGIPGLILKIYRPDIKLSLLESVRKKTDFIRDVIGKMNIPDVQVINGRAEEAGHDIKHRESYDIVVARAVSSLNSLLELCLPFAKLGGIFIAMKGGLPQQEIELSQKALKILGGKIVKCQEYILDEGSKRNLIIISKEQNCPAKYPRRPGIPGKNPL